MPTQIITTIEDDGRVSVAATGPLPLVSALGALEEAKLILSRPLFAPEPTVKAAPAAALHRLGDGR